MQVAFEGDFLREVLEAESTSRGLETRLRGLVVAREGDGLDEQEAWLDAADSMGLTAELREALESATGGLADVEVQTTTFHSVRGGMPTLRRDEHEAAISVEPARFAAVVDVCTALVKRQLDDIDKTAVTLPMGLGGSGGCACGDELPEDAAPGPLFQRSEGAPPSGN